MTADGSGAPPARWAYRPGEHWAVAGRGAAALLLGEAALELAERIWELLTGEGGDVDRIVEALTRDGLSHLPSFVVVEASGGTVRTLIRGTASVRLRLPGSGEPRTLDALGYRSWREELVPGVAGLVLGERDAEPEAGPLLPLLGGIVRAQELHLHGSPADDVAAPGAGSLPALPPPPRRSPRPAPPDLPAVEAPPALPAVDAAATLDDAAFAEDLAGPVGPPPAPPAEEPAADAAEGEDEYVAWVAGATRIGSIEDAAVRTGPDDAEAPVTGEQARAPQTWAPAPVLPEPPAVPPPSVPGPPPPPVAAVAPPTGPSPAVPPSGNGSAPGLISSVPFGSGRPARAPAPVAPPMAPPVASPVASPAPPAGGDVDSTVMRLPGRSGGDAPGSVGRAGWLPAVLCPHGHANPPESETCRVCRLDLADAEQRWVERPVVGSLRFSGPPGVLPVTGPMVIGRAPRADRVSGDALPEMVTVQSAEGDVSRSHLRIAVEGWHVLVVDLHAKNGTIVVDPGGEGRRLHPGEERMIVPGTRVLLSDDVQFVYEAAAQ